MSNKPHDKLLRLLLLYREQGDVAAGNELVKSLSKLVYFIIHKYVRNPVCKVEIDDLYQTGMIGVTKAIHSFDVHRDVSFSTYCYMKIVREVTREFHDHTHLIKLPYSNVADLRYFIDLSWDYELLYKGPLTHKQFIMAEMNIKEHKYWRLERALRMVFVRSFEEKVEVGDETFRLEELLSHENTQGAHAADRLGVNPEDSLVNEERNAELADIFEQLDEQQRALILSRLTSNQRQRKLTKQEQKILAPVQQKLKHLIG
jgi:RNA polymerase sigma factor (sigma-70 family)